jgi:hypothetical protein
MLFHIGVQDRIEDVFLIYFFTIVEYKNSILSSIPLFLVVNHVIFVFQF